MPNPSNKKLNPQSKALLGILESNARIGSSLTETALQLGVGLDTFRDLILAHPHLQNAWARGLAAGRRELREAQHELATDPDNRNQAVMLIWLGKNRLQQRDNDVLPPEPVPGMEESAEVASFADLVEGAALTEKSGPQKDQSPRPLPAGADKFMIVDTEAEEEAAPKKEKA